ncbi:MAG: hypothetical protein A2053_07015 [Deltaproteobacteria bacterium GWA2_50_8]|nr:MAG: hypothetical protein A2053_07015 [Deltaproteobacteria bacterium GWA2_50_8]OGQ26575.1 MAG: hypothetical protein A3B79_01180 [Deltaproteobacteria bacterium RIFCSPHIGHO2_02_FULL_50_15]
MSSFAIVQQVPYEGAGIFEECLQTWGHRYCYLRPYLSKSWLPRPEGLHDYDGYIFLGGPMSVNDQKEVPYLREEMALIQEGLRCRKPMLGVCLGAQLLAAAQGMPIYKGVREIGWAPIEFDPSGAPSDPLFSHFPEKLLVFHWHGETFDLPQGAIHLAQSSACRNQAFGIHRHAYGLQFHLEVTEEIIKDWVQKAGDQDIFLTDEQQREILETTKKEVENLNRLGRQFFQKFVQLTLK